MGLYSGSGGRSPSLGLCKNMGVLGCDLLTHRGWLGRVGFLGKVRFSASLFESVRDGMVGGGGAAAARMEGHSGRRNMRKCSLDISTSSSVNTGLGTRSLEWFRDPADDWEIASLAGAYKAWRLLLPFFHPFDAVRYSSSTAIGCADLLRPRCRYRAS